MNSIVVNHEKNLLEELSIIGEIREQLPKSIISYSDFFKNRNTNQTLTKNSKNLIKTILKKEIE